jgi:hypothetical protein
MKKLASYKNGNTYTTIYDDGTKTHFTKDNEFEFEFPESHDISISQCCDNGCEWCYYGCSPTGKHGKLIGWKFFETMHPYTEIAINLQSPVNPDLIPFLTEMRDRKIIVNATVNQNHFMDDSMLSLICHLEKHGLIKGIGVSLTNPRQDGFIETIREFPNAVIHVIAGITPWEDIQYLMGHDLKLLILGYKKTGRGKKYYDGMFIPIITQMKYLEGGLDEVINGFKVVSFDNLAIEQLHIKDRLSDKEWDMFYGGDDGTVTFFIDLVKGVFARNSLSQIVYPIGDKTIDEMFAIIKEEVANGEQKLS